MLIIAPEWPSPQYLWWAAVCALCLKRWQLPQDRPLYLRRGAELMPAPRWRTWAFLLDSGKGSEHKCPTTPAEPPTAGPPITGGNPGHGPGPQLMTAHRHTDMLPLGSRPGKVERMRDVQSFHLAGSTGRAPTTQSAAKPRPSSLTSPRRGPLDAHLIAGGDASQCGRTSAGETPRKIPPLGTPRKLRWQPNRNR